MAPAQQQAQHVRHHQPHKSYNSSHRHAACRHATGPNQQPQTGAAHIKARLRGLLVALIRRGIAEGEVTALDADAAAWHLLALVQGASAQLLYDARPEAEMRPLIAEAVARILGPRP